MREWRDEYLIVNSVDDLAPGVYVHHVADGQLEPLRRGNFRDTATRLAVPLFT
jgi:hypothetical protein